MDAVAMGEVSELEFRSQVPGAAHRCGHDIHTAVEVGIAHVLAGVRAELAERVVFLFQPAEENFTGAQAMISHGVLARIDVRTPEENRTVVELMTTPRVFIRRLAAARSTIG